MNSGAAEEASKVASSVVDALKSTPVVLALVIFNLMYMGLTFWSSTKERATWQGLVETAMKWCPTGPKREEGVIPNFTPTLMFIAAKETREQKLERVFEPQAPLLDADGEHRINAILQAGLDEALQEQIKHLFEVWMKDESNQPERAGVGARVAVKAYRHATRALKQREQKLERGEVVQ